MPAVPAEPRAVGATLIPTARGPGDARPTCGPAASWAALPHQRDPRPGRHGRGVAGLRPEAAGRRGAQVDPGRAVPRSSAAGNCCAARSAPHARSCPPTSAGSSTSWRRTGRSSSRWSTSTARRCSRYLKERGPLELQEATRIASQFLAGLEAIHQAGLVHRDVKPENIMITRTGRVVLMDFGVAKGVAETSGGRSRARRPTWRPSRCGARHSTPGRTSSPPASCSRRCDAPTGA